VILAVAVAAGPVYLAATRLINPRHTEEIRPVLEFVRDHWKTGDTLYLDYKAQYAFLYYEECKCLRLTHNGRELWPVRPLSGSDFLAPAVDSRTAALVVVKDLRQYAMRLRGQRTGSRVWLLYSHLDNAKKEHPIEQMLSALDKRGVRLNSINRTRAHAYLYELR
jgi:hypothetical protein